MSQTPFKMLSTYVQAFESLQAKQVVPFYELPCTFIRPDGVWVVQDEATAFVLANHLIEHAKSQGYHKTEISDVTMRTLAAGLVELTGVFIRYGASQTEIARFGFTYILRAHSDTWKIVVAVAHDANTESKPLSPVAGG